MQFIPAALPGVIIIEPSIFKDDRGFFMETYHQKKYAQAGITERFVQDNRSHSRQHTLRGLHYQIVHTQAKIVQVVDGDIFDVAVDIRVGSPAFGKWFGMRLSAENKRQMFIPGGFAHGFCVLSQTADVVYKCSDFYAPQDEYGILWSDTAIGINWPVKTPVLSPKDRHFPCLNELTAAQLPTFNESVQP